MAKVVWTQEAERWLLKIHDYIARDKPGAAFDVLKSIYARAQVLEQFPKSGQSYRTKAGREARILIWGHYRTPISSRGRTKCTSWACFTALWSWIDTSSSTKPEP